MSVKILLASASPRRAELMKNSGFSVRILPSGADESFCESDPPEKIAEALARKKALAVAPFAEDGEIVVAADTSVVYGGEILGKPKDEEDALRMLMTLSGKTHEVYTGVAVSRGGKTICAVDRTLVTFRPFGKDLALRYIATGEPMDKAGAYGIQKFGPALVEGINGDYFNVVGLPLRIVFSILEKDFSISPLSWLEK